MGWVVDVVHQMVVALLMVLGDGGLN